MTHIASGRPGGLLSDDLRTMEAIAGPLQQVNAFSDLTNKTANLWKGLQTDQTDLSRALAFYSEISGALANIAMTPDSLRACKEPIAHILESADILLEPVSTIATAARRYVECLGSYDASLLILEGRCSGAGG